MRFVQTISFTSDRFDEMLALMESFAEGDAADAPGFIRSTVAKDRDHEGHYVVIAEFENYEVAMENSAKPETDAFAQRMAELSSGPPTFANYDVVHVDEA